MRTLKRLFFGAAVGVGAAFLARQVDAVRRVNVWVTKLRHRREVPKSYDDTTLARKVETELFRAEDAPKGKVDVSVAGGVVTLRGELPTDELIRDLLEQTRSIQGVESVENLLHTPGSPAPMHQ
jgi:osmotically-inducible protein OsmY